MPILHRWGIDKVIFRSLLRDRAKYMAYSKAQAAERTSAKHVDPNRKDFFYYLLKARDPETGEGFSTPELWGESNTLIIAGKSLSFFQISLPRSLVSIPNS